MNDLADTPFFEKYRPYQLGFVQDRHGALDLELKTLIRFYITKGKERTKILNLSFKRKIDELKERKIITQSMYQDLNLVNLARNEFVKSAPLAPDEQKIRNLLNNVKCLWWEKEKRKKYSIYRLILISISQTHITLTNTPEYKKYLKELFKIMHEEAIRKNKNVK